MHIHSSRLCRHLYVTTLRFYPNLRDNLKITVTLRIFRPYFRLGNTWQMMKILNLLYWKSFFFFIHDEYLYLLQCHPQCHYHVLTLYLVQHAAEIEHIVWYMDRNYRSYRNPASVPLTPCLWCQLSNTQNWSLPPNEFCKEKMKECLIIIK